MKPLENKQIVWLARHGNRQDFVDVNWRLTAERPYDPGLSEDGIVQAQRLAERLVNEGICCVYTSPFLRTIETAHQVARRLDVPLYLEAGLSEWQNPAWFAEKPRLLAPESLIELFPHVDPTYTSRIVPFFPESESEALSRSAETGHCLADGHKDPILLVGHAISVAGAVMGLVDGLSYVDCPLCSLFRLSRNGAGTWETDLCGDVAHLERAEGMVRIWEV